MGRDGEKEEVTELAPHVSGVEDKKKEGIGVHMRR